MPEFVVNLVPHALAGSMNDTAALLPYGESEFAAFGIAPAPSTKVRPPRVGAGTGGFRVRPATGSSTSATGPLAANVVFGRILAAHVRDDVIGADGFPDAAKLDLVGRLGRRGLRHHPGHVRPEAARPLNQGSAPPVPQEAALARRAVRSRSAS